MALPFHAPADLPLLPGAWDPRDALQVFLSDALSLDQEDTGESQVRWSLLAASYLGLDLAADDVDWDIIDWDQALVPGAGMDDDADWEDWEDWEVSPLDLFWETNSGWDDALVPDDEEDDQDAKGEEEDQDTEGQEDNQTVPEWSPSSPSPDLVPSRPPVSSMDFEPLAGARRHRDEEDNQTVPEWSPSSPSPDLVPSRRPVSSLGLVPLTGARRHRDEEEEEESISKRPRFSYDEYIG